VKRMNGPMNKHSSLPYPEQDAYQLGPNEPLGTGSINRVIEHLLKNDDTLLEKTTAIGCNHVLQLWSQNAIYSPGDLSVYIADKDDGGTIAYILLCISANAKKPEYVFRDGFLDFSGSGWNLIHSATLYLHDDDLLLENIINEANEKGVKNHEADLRYHDGVIINSIDDFDKMFLKNDLSNFTTSRITRDDGTSENSFNEGAIASSLLSDDIYITRSSDKVIEMDVTFAFDHKANQDIEILNSRYFYQTDPVRDKSDNHIFGSYYLESTQRIWLKNIGTIYENIRIPGTNIFSHEIKFPVELANTEYMIFQSSYRPDQFVFAATASEISQRKYAGEQPFVSSMFFVNKTSNSVTAILPIHSHFGKYGKFVVGVPWINEFKVRIVGFEK